MTTQIRTVWLLGFIGLLATSAGCVESHHGSRPSAGNACLDQQYFEVAWGIDNGRGTRPYTCSEIDQTVSHVELLTNAPAPDDRLSVDFYVMCDDTWSCPGNAGLKCNMDGTTFSGLAAGTTILEADLIGGDGSPLSSFTADPGTPPSAIPSCNPFIASYVFSLH